MSQPGYAPLLRTMPAFLVAGDNNHIQIGALVWHRDRYVYHGRVPFASDPEIQKIQRMFSRFSVRGGAA